MLGLTWNLAKITSSMVDPTLPDFKHRQGDPELKPEKNHCSRYKPYLNRVNGARKSIATNFSFVNLTLEQVP